MSKYRTTIKAREAAAEQYAALIRQTFEYTNTIFIRADVEGAPNPDEDTWGVRAEVMPDTHIWFQLYGANRDKLVLAMVVKKAPDQIRNASGSTGMQSFWRETLFDIDECLGWIWLVKTRFDQGIFDDRT